MEKTTDPKTSRRPIRVGDKLLCNGWAFGFQTYVDHPCVAIEAERMDFYCECGAHCHFDGYFANVVKCPHCKTEWQMPFNLFPRKHDPKLEDSCDWTPQMMEPDEDMEAVHAHP